MKLACPATIINISWKRTSKGVLSLFAGGASGYSDAIASNAWFQGPQDVVVDSYTNIFVTDGSSIRKVHPDGSVTTLKWKWGQS